MIRNKCGFLGAVAVFAAVTVLSGCGDNGSSYVRVVHASADAPNVDVKVSGTFVATNAAFGTSTKYVAVGAGTARPAAIYAAGSDSKPVLSAKIDIVKKTVTTIFAVNKVANLAAIVYPETDTAAPPSGSFKLRAVHAASTAPIVDVYVTAPEAELDKVKPTIPGFTYKTVSPYLTVPVGTYRVRITPVNTPDTVVIDSGAVAFTSGQILSGVALDGTKAGTFGLLVTDDTPPVIK